MILKTSNNVFFLNTIDYLSSLPLKDIYTINNPTYYLIRFGLKNRQLFQYLDDIASNCWTCEHYFLIFFICF